MNIALKPTSWAALLAAITCAITSTVSARDGLYLQRIHITSGGSVNATNLDLMPYQHSRDLLMKLTGLELGVRPDILTVESPTLNSLTFNEMLEILRLNPGLPDPIPADVLAQASPNDILLFVVDKVYDGEAFACCSENQANGLAQVNGNRFIYANGGIQAGFPDSFTSVVQSLWARVFVHELGHNSGLLHIGDAGETAANDAGNLMQAFPSNDVDLDIYLEESQRVRMLAGLTNQGLIQDVDPAHVPGNAAATGGSLVDHRITVGTDANGPVYRYPVTVGVSYAIETSSDLRTWSRGTSFVADSNVYRYHHDQAHGGLTNFVRLVQP